MAVERYGYQPAPLSAFLGPRYWPIWLGLGFLRLGLVVPRRLWAAIGASLGDLYFLLNAKRRRVARLNIKWCFPALSVAAQRRLVRRHFRVAMQSALDVGWLWWAPERRLLAFARVVGIEHYHAAVARGQRVILVTCHCVGIELGAVIAHYFPLVAPFKPTRNALINRYITAGRLRFGGSLFTRDQGLRPVVRGLKSGSGLYYLPDEDLGLDDAVFAPFFGVSAATLTTVGRLAQLTGAAVLPYIPQRRADGRGYDLVIYPALTNFPGGDVVQDATLVNRAIEDGLRAIPEQYLWTFKRFKTRPDGAPSPYG